jgi:hypothetical protein
LLLFIESHSANIYIHRAFMQNLFAQLFPNSTILCSFSLSFQRYSVDCGTRSQASKSQGLLRANYFFAYIKMPDYRIYNSQISIFSNRFRKICHPNCSKTRLYYAVFHALANDVQQIGAQSHQRQNGKY